MNSYKNRFGIYLLVLISFLVCDLRIAGSKPHYNAIEYGAKADGQTLDTKAIQRAIDECSKDGGGTIEFPAGTYLTGTIYLKDNVILNLQPGSKILGSKNLEDYPLYLSEPENNIEKNFVFRALIRGDKLKNVRIFLLIIL